MFPTIFLFEVQNRLRRPAIYVYVSAALLFMLLTFATGSMPLAEREHINAPYMIAFWCAWMSMLTMIVSSSVMGMSLYRDIAFNTKDYYLTYPITRAGYFWGRFAGSFLFMIILGLSIIAGAYLGTLLGPVTGWRDFPEYGPNHLIYYLQPLLTIVLPNLFFTASVFYGLVALTRNVSVIYAGGILLFLGYFISFFFLDHTNNRTVMFLADPFALIGVHLQNNESSYLQQNTSVIPLTGEFLTNRLIWTGLGVVILLVTWLRFNFETFFSGKRDKIAVDEAASKGRRSFIRAANTAAHAPAHSPDNTPGNPPANIPDYSPARSPEHSPANTPLAVRFSGAYNRQTLANLIKIELTNILRDPYFWIIMGGGALTLGLAFWMGDEFYGVVNFPRSVMLMDTFNNVFIFFVFFIILFYTGETLHRDRVTRYSFINDSLPPPNWVLHGSKLLSLLTIGVGLSLIPVIVGLPVQFMKGFHQFNLPLYGMYETFLIIPHCLEMVLFAWFVHVVVNSKFAGHAVGAVIWIGIFFLESSGTFNYHLFLYGYTPGTGVSDMDGLGHMARPIGWFHGYWLLFGGLLVIGSALFYYRGVSSSFKERLQLLPERFGARTRIFGGIILLLFLATGGWLYYNVSYLNNFLTGKEAETRAILYEQNLKRYGSLPMPKVTAIKMIVELFPDRQAAFTTAQVTIVNKTSRPVSQLLLDGDELTDYSIRSEGQDVPFTVPLSYPRGGLNWFRPGMEEAPFRLYQLRKVLGPGDSSVLDISASVVNRGFCNALYGEKLLRNGTFYPGGLPELGYDEHDEISSPYLRRKNHLPLKKEEEIAQDDPEGIRTLKAGKTMDLCRLDITVSTSGDQIAIAPGSLQHQWQHDGRNYFRYVQTQPGLYQPIGILSAKYALLTDSVQLDHKVYIRLYYHPEHSVNIQRLAAGYKEGLVCYTAAYGPYPFDDIRLAEGANYAPRQASMSTLDAYAEYFGWNAHFIDPNQFDYCYFATAKDLAQQWFRFQVAPNETVGSMVIPEGLSVYSALAMCGRKYGKDNMKSILQEQLWPYLFGRTRLTAKEHPLINADQWFEWGGKAGIALYGLRDLIGEDSLNAALRAFKNDYAFRNHPPYAGANDLYRYLKQRTPDSLLYYLNDTWQKVTLYDNKMLEATARPTGQPDEYTVTLKVQAGKRTIDDSGKDVPAPNMNDYINIGIFGGTTFSKEGRFTTHPLYMHRFKMTGGIHVFTMVVKGRPESAGIDPYNILVDSQPNDNIKKI